jgi:hypothetical protein
MKAKKYITQITAQDMKELEAVTNLEAGWLIRIDRDQGKIKIGIDQTAFALALNGFFRNGGMQTYAANCTEISFNPPS